MNSAPSESDHELIVAAIAGDVASFGRLVARYQHDAVRIAALALGSAVDADDVAQDAFVKAFTNIHRFDGRAAFTTWVTRIAINTCLDRLRRRRREGLRAEDDEDGMSPLDLVVDDRTTPDERAEQRQAVRRLAELETALPDRQRQIFRLRFYAELDLVRLSDGEQTSLTVLPTVGALLRSALPF